jgi:hypothetical protein
MILVYSAIALLALFVLVTCGALIEDNRSYARRIKSGDIPADRASTLYRLTLGRYCLEFGGGWYGCKGTRRYTIVDPGRVIDGKPVVVGYQIGTKHVHLTWALKWPYPWINVPEGWQRKHR